MKAIQLTGYKGFESMQLFEVEKPKPAANEVLLEVKAAGVNFAELELTKGRYRIPKEPPFIMGFEAAGVVVELGARVKNLKVGDRITSLVSTGGYAEFATADATVAIPIPEGISFNEAATIPVQGLSAYALLKLAAKPQASETLLVQSAAGGVGLYLVQLARIMALGDLLRWRARRKSWMCLQVSELTWQSITPPNNGQIRFERRRRARESMSFLNLRPAKWETKASNSWRHSAV